MSSWTPRSGAIGDRLVDTLLTHLHSTPRPELGEKGLSVDETLLLGGVVPFAVVALVRVVVRRRSRTTSTVRGRSGGRRA